MGFYPFKTKLCSNFDITLFTTVYIEQYCTATDRHSEDLLVHYVFRLSCACVFFVVSDQDLQAMPVCYSGDCHIELPMSKNLPGQVEADLVQRLSLALVDCHREAHRERILLSF